MSNEPTVEQAQAKVDALTTEADELRQQILAMEESIKASHVRLRDLVGSFHGYGEIQRAKQRLDDAKRKVRDADLRVVVWAERGYKDEESTYVIDKVTTKRIFVRIRGAQGFDQYTHDGKPVSYGSQRIDIAATFGPDGPVPGK